MISAQKLKPETRIDVERVIVSLDIMLRQRETESKRILARIKTLVAHYWVGKEDELSSAAKFMDWYEALKSFPYWAIEEACKEWMANETRKPAIAQIRALAVTAITEPQRLKDRLMIVSGATNEIVKDPGKSWQDMDDDEKAKMQSLVGGAADGCKP